MSEESGIAAFNMALSTLEKLQKILIEIKQFSIEGLQHSKFKAALQFHMQSSPLVSKKEGVGKMKKLKDRLREIKLERIKIVRHGDLIGYEPRYSQKIDYEIDDILEEIQILLQEEGYFMPPSESEEMY